MMPLAWLGYSLLTLGLFAGLIELISQWRTRRHNARQLREAKLHPPALPPLPAALRPRHDPWRNLRPANTQATFVPTPPDESYTPLGEMLPRPADAYDYHHPHHEAATVGHGGEFGGAGASADWSAPDSSSSADTGSSSDSSSSDSSGGSTD